MNDTPANTAAKSAISIEECLEGLRHATLYVPMDESERVRVDEKVNTARSELSALRQRAEDAELVLRTVLDRKPNVYRDDSGERDGWWIRWRNREMGEMFVVDTGEVILTPAARAALKGTVDAR